MQYMTTSESGLSGKCGINVIIYQWVLVTLGSHSVAQSLLSRLGYFQVTSIIVQTGQV